MEIIVWSRANVVTIKCVIQFLDVPAKVAMRDRIVTSWLEHADLRLMVS